MPTPQKKSAAVGNTRVWSTSARKSGVSPFCESWLSASNRAGGGVVYLESFASLRFASFCEQSGGVCVPPRVFLVIPLTLAASFASSECDSLAPPAAAAPSHPPLSLLRAAAISSLSLAVSSPMGRPLLPATDPSATLICCRSFVFVAADRCISLAVAYWTCSVHSMMALSAIVLVLL